VTQVSQHTSALQHFSMSSSDSMPFPQRVIAIAAAASATPRASLAFRDATKDHLTMPALAALCRHYGLEVDGTPTEDSVSGPCDDSLPFPRRILAIAQACGGDGPRDTNHSPLCGEVLDNFSIPALAAVAIRYGLITVEA